jgi:hypothetical protein
MSDMSKTGGNGETTADLERIGEDVVALREDLARVVKHFTRNAKGEMSEEARRLYAKLSDTGKRSTTAIAREVEERPLFTMLLAFGIGFIGGSLLRR